MPRNSPYFGISVPRVKPDGEAKQRVARGEREDETIYALLEEIYDAQKEHDAGVTIVRFSRDHLNDFLDLAEVTGPYRRKIDRELENYGDMVGRTNFMRAVRSASDHRKRPDSPLTKLLQYCKSQSG
ncbi:TPA: hypothetical protein HA278_06035 [Candidatus Woesearchaeota archaeon]|nr:hypothetical protein [archaeon]HIJ11591.1 hypothetical protein [Candidatus Woesearchaeota archaeon]